MFLGYNFPTMKKYLLGFLSIFLISVLITSQYEKYPYDATNPSQNSGGAAVSPGNTPKTTGNPQQPQNDPPRWLRVSYQVFGWPNGITVWALFLTMMVVAEQTSQTRRAAEATAISADATEKQAAQVESQTGILRDSVGVAQASADAAQRNIELTILKEQARIKVRVGNLTIVELDGGVFMAVVKVEVFNFGATKAFIGRNHIDFDITDSKTSHVVGLPDPLTTEPVIHATENPVEKTLSFFTDTGSDTIRALNVGELFAHLHGMVSYTDVFERQHEIRFRYMWTPDHWVVAIQPIASPGAIEKTLFGEWQKHGGDQDNHDENPN